MLKRFLAIALASCLSGVYLAALSGTPSFACNVNEHEVSAAKLRIEWLTADHPLVARVFNVREPWTGIEPLPTPSTSCAQYSNEFVQIGNVLAKAIDDGAIVMLGEIHDNSAHHRYRASRIFKSSRATNERPAPGVVFEQFSTNRQSALDAFAEAASKSPGQVPLAEFKRLTDWEKSGWQQYNYDPLLQAALNAQLPLYAGDVPRASIMQVAKEGEAALSADERARLKLNVPLGSKGDEASLSEIVESHCNMMPKEALRGMAYAQRYRDATLADTVLRAAGQHGSAILIAGNGHVRTDRGVPWYVRQRAAGTKVISVVLVEVEDGKTDPEAYVPRDPDGKPVADYVIFTPRAERADECAKMRAKMKK